MSRYEGVDFYRMEQHLTEEEIMVRDLVRDWVDEKVIPIIEEYYTKGTFPTELILLPFGHYHLINLYQ